MEIIVRGASRVSYRPGVGGVGGEATLVTVIGELSALKWNNVHFLPITATCKRFNNHLNFSQANSTQLVCGLDIPSSMHEM